MKEMEKGMQERKAQREDKCVRLDVEKLVKMVHDENMLMEIKLN